MVPKTSGQGQKDESDPASSSSEEAESTSEEGTEESENSEESASAEGSDSEDVASSSEESGSTASSGVGAPSDESDDTSSDEDSDEESDEDSDDESEEDSLEATEEEDSEANSSSEEAKDGETPEMEPKPLPKEDRRPWDSGEGHRLGSTLEPRMPQTVVERREAAARAALKRMEREKERETVPPRRSQRRRKGRLPLPKLIPKVDPEPDWLPGSPKKQRKFSASNNDQATATGDASKAEKRAQRLKKLRDALLPHSPRPLPRLTKETDSVEQQTSADEKLRDFPTKAQRREAAIVIQKTVRGWFARRWAAMLRDHQIAKEMKAKGLNHAKRLTASMVGRWRYNKAKKAKVS